jgi:hypothetical protein
MLQAQSIAVFLAFHLFSKIEEYEKNRGEKKGFVVVFSKSVVSCLFPFFVVCFCFDNNILLKF